MEDLSIGQNGWNADLLQNSTGDLLTVTDSDLGIHRVIRRLFTNPQAALFHPEYGGGLLAKIGSPIPASTILGVVRKQMFQEAVVAQQPAPQVVVKEVPQGSGEQVITITYQDQQNGGLPMLIQFKPGTSAV